MIHSERNFEQVFKIAQVVMGNHNNAVLDIITPDLGNTEHLFYFLVLLFGFCMQIYFKTSNINIDDISYSDVMYLTDRLSYANIKLNIKIKPLDEAPSPVKQSKVIYSYDFPVSNICDCKMHIATYQYYLVYFNLEYKRLLR
jgi:hypothetical protein